MRTGIDSLGWCLIPFPNLLLVCIAQYPGVLDPVFFFHIVLALHNSDNRDKLIVFAGSKVNSKYLKISWSTHQSLERIQRYQN